MLCCVFVKWLAAGQLFTGTFRTWTTAAAASSTLATVSYRLLHLSSLSHFFAFFDNSGLEVYALSDTVSGKRFKYFSG
jgi:hypothetical protein